jgi:hypothetical protein
MILFMRVLLSGLLLAAASCAPPHRDLPPAQIEALGRLSDVMDVQATVADPQFKKAGAASYDDADWAAFADMGSRLQVTSQKIHQFSKGPEFDKLADQLHALAATLSTAAASKDVTAAKTALVQTKATCKACHSKFK